MSDHPITPPPELVEQWCHDSKQWMDFERVVAIRAAQWGADQELEACCEWLDRNNQWARCDIDELRDGRRPKTLSLKEQALLAIDTAVADDRLSADVASVARRALEQLDD
jgi:hypothetical protein